MSPFSNASSAGATGGVKKLKKDSVGRALRTSRVRFVSASEMTVSERGQTDGKRSEIARTFVALLLDLELLGEVLVLFPLDLGADRTVVHEIARVADLLAVDIGLFEDGVLEELVLLKDEEKLEAGLGVAGGEVLDAEVDEVLEGGGVALGDELGEADVVTERGEPELGDRGGGGG